MSATAAHQSKSVRRSCEACRARKARFRYRGEVRADRDHTLCFECFRSQCDRQRAGVLAHQRPVGRAPLGQRQIAHRYAMLAHLRGQSA